MQWQWWCSDGKAKKKCGIWRIWLLLSQTGDQCNQHCCAYVQTLIKNPTPIISFSLTLLALVHPFLLWCCPKAATTVLSDVKKIKSHSQWCFPPQTQFHFGNLHKNTHTHDIDDNNVVVSKNLKRNKRNCLKQTNKRVNKKLHMCNWLKMQFVAFYSSQMTKGCYVDGKYGRI